MTLCEFADVIGANLIIDRFPRGEFICTLAILGSGGRSVCAVRKNESIIETECGRGSSPNIAIRDFIKTIQGKRIVFNAYHEKERKEFQVPNKLRPELF